MTGPAHARARLWIALAGIGLACAALHWVNLLYLSDRFDCALPQLSCAGEAAPWITPDSKSYVRVADDIDQRGVLHASYLQRTPGFPFLLSCARRAFGDITSVLWFVPLLAGAACVAIGWHAFAFAGTTRAALAASLLFTAWPPAYQLAPMLLTDAAHGFVAAIAFAATVAWLRTHGTTSACLAAAAWLLTQAIRPTFFPLPLLLPVLLWRKGESRRIRSLSLAIWLASGLVPAFVVASNHLQHGMPIVSIVEPTTLAAYAIPRLEQELGRGSVLELRKQALERYASLADPKERVALQRREAWAHLRAHPKQALWSFGNEFRVQLFHSLRPVWPELEARARYPSWLPAKVTIYVFWISAALGLVTLALHQPRIALFLLLAFAAVMLPATTSHLVGGRLRFPLDLLFMPVVAAFFDRLYTSVRRIAQP